MDLDLFNSCRAPLNSTLGFFFGKGTLLHFGFLFREGDGERGRGVEKGRRGEGAEEGEFREEG